MSFEVVSEKEWGKALKQRLNSGESTYITPYEELVDLIPRRSTKFSAGYDFRSPVSINCVAGEVYTIPTGFKCNFDTLGINTIEQKCDIDHWDVKEVELYKLFRPAKNSFLALYPRSSYGLKYGFRLLNTTGIIDYDYYANPDNEGHIMVAFTSMKNFELNVGDKFCQGIFQLYATDMNELTDQFVERVGGIGSTGK